MKKGLRIGIFSGCLLAVFTLAPHQAYAAACPNSTKYAQIIYNHQLLNQHVNGGTFSEASGVTGAAGIQISPSGITNAGNAILQRSIDLVFTTEECDCVAETAYAHVTVTVSGKCVNGVLDMQIHEVYEDTSAMVTCAPDDSCPDPYSQPYPGSTTDFSLKMNYVNGTKVVRSYTCPTCIGNYSWTLQFTNEPPPEDEFPPVSLVPILHLMLRQANK
jgi:hypothetical protein